MTDQTRREFMRTTGTVLAAAAAAGSAASPGAAGATAGSGTAPAITQLAPPDKQPPDLKVPQPKDPKKTVGYAIVGLGTLALNQILPAFAKAKLSRPVALVSGHPDKAKQVAQVYGINSKSIYTYDDYDKIRDNADVSAVYNVLPNHMHAEYTIRAARAGKHVLCEKPMAPTVADCEKMIAACRDANRKLMIAYRLHYEPYNMRAIEIMKRRELGKLLVIESSNVQDTKAPDIRLSKATAGGPLGDIGVYCINACRYLTQEEPAEVTAQMYQPADDPNFAEVPRDVVWTMSFPSGASSHCGVSFGGAGSRRYRVHCTDGWLDLENAFGYDGQELYTKKGNQKTQFELPHVDHFAAEMDHFSDCILNDKQPATPGEEGLADMKVIAAIQESARTGKRVKL
jgi:predicted dehydrogenase